MTPLSQIPRIGLGPLGVGGRVAADDWWLAGGVNPADVIAAYQPIGAADLAASYVNLASPGMFDASSPASPSLSANGWGDFSGGKYVLSGASLPANTTTYSLAILVNVTGAGEGNAGRAFDQNARLRAIPNNAGLNLSWAYGNSATNAPAVSGWTVLIMTGQIAGYRNGIAVSTFGGTLPSAGDLYIGNESTGLRGLSGFVGAFALWSKILSIAEAQAVSAAMAALI